jgi:hypothetical protein
MMISVRYGNFNWAQPKDEQVLIQVTFPADMNPPMQNYSETWDINNDPFSSDIPPSEWATIFQSRLNQYLLATDRELKAKTLKWMADNASELDLRWANKRILFLENRIKNITRDIARLQEIYYAD